MKAIIKVKRANLLDISDPNSEDRQAINVSLPKLINRMKQRGFRIPKESAFLEGLIIDELCKSKTYKVIRATTITSTDYNEDPLIRLGIASTVELWVKDKSLIDLQ